MHLEQTLQKSKVSFGRQRLMFGRFKKLHFVGIGGAGMSGIGEILHNLGFSISGSDSTPSEVTQYLQSIGIEVQAKHEAVNLSGADVLVISSAIEPDNAELVEARRLGIPVIKRAEMLGELMRLKYAVAIAGTHGKTTTTSMIGRILQQADLDPTLVVGGIVAELGTGAALGSGDYLVAEADEYDRSIEAMFPTMALLLNIEADHLDCYADMDDLRSAFLDFLNRVPFYGSVVLSIDDANIVQLIPRLTRPHVTFGFSEDADYHAVDITGQGVGSVFSVVRHEAILGQINLPVPGRHNISNALAAVAASMELDISFEKIAETLRDFKGVGRRFEMVGKVNDIILIDDYAHHPTEVRATLTTAKEVYKRRLLAVFQPHLFSRTKQFLTEFATELSTADHCILTDIYPAREEPIKGLTSESILEEAERLGYKNFSYVGKKENAIDEVIRLVAPGDMVITIGAGSITHIRNLLLERLSK